MKHIATPAPLARLAAIGFLVMNGSFQGMNAYAESPPPPPPPTLDVKVKESAVIVVATVGPVKYMEWSESDGRYTGEMSGTPRKGSFSFFQLLNPGFLKISPSTQRAIDIVALKSTPLWAGLGHCLPNTYLAADDPPTGEVRIFFLHHPGKSKGAMHMTECRFQALPLSAQSSIEEILRQSKSNTN